MYPRPEGMRRPMPRRGGPGDRMVRIPRGDEGGGPRPDINPEAIIELAKSIQQEHPELVDQVRKGMDPNRGTLQGLLKEIGGTGMGNDPLARHTNKPMSREEFNAMQKASGVNRESLTTEQKARFDANPFFDDIGGQATMDHMAKVMAQRGDAIKPGGIHGGGPAVKWGSPEHNAMRGPGGRGDRRGEWLPEPSEWKRLGIGGGPGMRGPGGENPNLRSIVERTPYSGIDQRDGRPSQMMQYPSREAQYLKYAQQQEGWNPEWNRYVKQLMYKLENPDYNLTENTHGPGGQGAMAGIPAVVVAEISEFVKGLKGMDDDWGYVDYTDA